MHFVEPSQTSASLPRLRTRLTGSPKLQRAAEVGRPQRLPSVGKLLLPAARVIGKSESTDERGLQGERCGVQPRLAACKRLLGCSDS